MTIKVIYTDKVSYATFYAGISLLQNDPSLTIDEDHDTVTLTDPDEAENQIVAKVSGLETDADGNISGGTVKALHVKGLGKEALSITGLAVDATALMAALESGSTDLYTFSVDALVGDLTGIGNNDTNYFEVGVTGKADIKAKGGDDQLYIWHKKNVTYDGGGGSDSVTFDSMQGNTPDALHGLVLDLATGKGTNPYGGKVTLKNVEQIYGSGADDLVTGSAAADIVSGSFGNDTLKGLNGNDSLAGSYGNDTLIGGKGDDFLNGGEGADILSGGDGKDSTQYSGYGPETTTTIVDLTDKSNNTEDAEGDVITSVEEFTFSYMTVGFTGTAAAELVQSRYGGNDSFDMGGGNDTVVVDGGGDTVNGGTGRDTVEINGDITIDLVTPANNTGEAVGSTFISIEIFRLGDTGGTIAFYGDDAANTVYGGGGVGSHGTIDGRGGNDKLIGGGGGDDLTGGAGADQFIYADRLDSSKINDGGASLDVIEDFSRADGDLIDLVAIDANGNKKGYQDFSYIGAKDFSGKAGELRFEKEGGDTYVYADTDGINGGDFAIRIVGEVNFVKADFML